MKTPLTTGRPATRRPPHLRVLGVAGLMLLPAGLTSCGNQDRTINADTRIGTAPPGVTPVNLKLGDLLDEPGKFAGQTVTVSGEVNDVIGSKVFSIGGEEFLPPGELLVVSPTGFPSIPDRPENEYLVDDDIVQVTGTVRIFVRTEISRDVDMNDLEGEAYAEWEGKPVLVASNVVTTPRARREGAGAAATPVTDILVIVNTPDRLPLVGTTVDLRGVKVQSVVSDKGFWIGPSAEKRLFVRLDEERTPGTPIEGKVDVNSGQTVSLSGTIRKAPATAEMQSRWGLTPAEMEPLKNERVFIHAERVQVQQR